MRVRHNPIDALATLARLTTSDERRAYWRQALTALGEPGRVESPPPLDGLAPDVLVRAVQVALEAGLLDDVEWAAPERAAIALYEMTSALPSGPERHALGRRMFQHLYQGTASTFAAVATRMAVGSAKPLETPALRARVQLVYSLPVGSSVNADALALTLVARRELFERWIAGSASGTLPARRMAAVMLERAAREVVMRAQQGDPGATAVFFNPRVQVTYKTLLADREPLVWRHAAVARGLLSSVEPSLREEIDLELDPALTPTEWRRAVVSLVACLTHDHETALSQCRSLIRGELAERHPSLVSTFVWGLEPVIESEPDLAEELLDLVSEVKRSDVAETLAALLSDVHPPSFGRRAAQRMQISLREELARADEQERVLISATLKQLESERHDVHSIVGSVRAALIAFETTGARTAYEMALGALARAGLVLESLESSDAADPDAELYDALVNLDTGAIESSRLYDLLLLGRRPGDSNASVEEMERLYDRFGDWLLTGNGAHTSVGAVPAPWLKRKWLALLHLIDVETARRSGNEHIATRVAWRIQSTIRSLVQRVAEENEPKLQRVFCATLARAFDAAVREGVAEPTDLLLLGFLRLHQAESVRAVVDASTTEDVRQAFAAYATFLERALPAEPVIELSLEDDGARLARAVVALASGVNMNASYRGEALRQALLRMARGIEAAEAATSLTDLAETEHGGISDLERACFDLSKLVSSAYARLFDETVSAPSESYTDGTRLGILIDQAVSSGQAPAAEPLAQAALDLAARLPAAFAALLTSALTRLPRLPLEASSAVASRRARARSAPLPDWLLPRRTIGGFYVVSSLGSGGVSSVFVARRIEVRHESKAELYALKVPKYDPAIARSLTEQQFLELFREEAGALLALPKHPNLARFVNFDVEARPKPILVMELIRGDSLERVLRRNALTVASAVKYLDGILAGLAAMHSVGVGHLDVKPANVILRDEATAVLVDFGLSGRHIRPGCGTLDYCAPEVLGVVPQGCTPSPAATDIYAFACIAFEILTTKNLIEGRDENTMIAKHVEHDGWPTRLAEFARVDGARELGVLLARCLRRDPRLRPTALEVRRALGPAAHALTSSPWPLPRSRRALAAAG
jgi:eukaryotic-like serine/threonine-protein kinase